MIERNLILVLGFLAAAVLAYFPPELGTSGKTDYERLGFVAACIVFITAAAFVLAKAIAKSPIKHGWPVVVLYFFVITAFTGLSSSLKPYIIPPEVQPEDPSVVALRNEREQYIKKALAMNPGLRPYEKEFRNAVHFGIEFNTVEEAIAVCKSVVGPTYPR